MPPLIEVGDISRVFTGGAKTVFALEHVSCDIHTGNFVSIVGPSGCGKSTLLKIISGLLPASSGTVTINGTPVITPLANVGMVFQAPVLLKWRSVLDNILLPVEFAKLDSPSYIDKARALIKRACYASLPTKLCKSSRVACLPVIPEIWFGPSNHQQE